jgi:hypothetical protein
MNTVKATWSDAARKASAEARRASEEVSGVKDSTVNKDAFHHNAAEAHFAAMNAHIDGDQNQAEWHKKHMEFHQKAATKLRGYDIYKASAPSPQDVVRAAGTSEGAKKGWEKRQAADKLSSIAESHQGGVLKEQMKAHDAHSEAAHAHFNAHWEAKNAGDSEGADKHWAKMNEHYEKSRKFKTFSGGNSLGGVMASEVTTGLAGEVIHCRSHASAAGSVLAADKAWNPGEPVEFMWMPAGTHTICAGFRNGSIELTVNCDENTAANVQASLDAWRTERPKQEPFGCVEHREHEASVRVSAQQAFSFKDDGVYIAAEPTMLGAQNVNGKVHRSWSPSFTTDADYSQAKTVKTASGATVMVFPEGVRGSRSNPAEITGVDFCVGTLTNKPAFHAMSPVKGSEVEAVTASGTSEGAKKGWLDRNHSSGSAFNQSERARQFSKDAEGKTDKTYHRYAYVENKSAMEHHTHAARELLDTDDHEHAKEHFNAAQEHFTEAQKHLVEERRLRGMKAAASSLATPSTSVHASHATLLQDVPDATPAEIACYEKCIDEGGSHVTAVSEIKAKRRPEYVTQPAKASEPTTPDTILARHQAALEAANSIAAEHGATKLTAEDVYERFSVLATGTSEGAKKGWTVRMHSNSSGKGTWTNLHLEHAESKEDAEKQAAAKGKGSAYPHVGEARPSYRQKNNFNVKRADGKTVSVYIPGDEARGSDESIELESIYARAGANR